MVYRVYVEKKPGFDLEAKSTLADLKSSLGIDALKDVRMFNRYDAENMSKEQFDYAVRYVFSEPQMDVACEMPDFGGAKVFAVEFLPGQFDQRADSAAQCIQLIFQGERPLTRSARVYALYGDLTDADIAAIKKYVINPVEAREAAADKPETLAVHYDIPTEVATVEGFTDMTDEDLAKYIKANGLAMDEADLAMVRNYFASEHRDPTITEVSLSRGSSAKATDGTTMEQLVAILTTNEPMDTELHDRIERWLKVRLNNENVILVCQLAEIEMDAK